MKKTLFTFVLLVAFIASHAQPNITNLSYPSSVGLFDLYEISFNLGPYGNPYDPDTISVYAVFTAPDNSHYTVLGFYYEGYVFQFYNGYEVASPISNDIGWKIRFTPSVTGTWTFRIHAIDSHGRIVQPNTNQQPYAFTCTAKSNAKGFISTANAKYLKRDVVNSGHRLFHSFFPVGPNVAWYSCNASDPNNPNNTPYWPKDRPIGIYDYDRYIDSLSGNANYMRIWLNRYQYLNLYGPEYTILENNQPKVYFDSTLNQKDAAELDHIISYAAENDIAVMLCFFSCGDFNYSSSDPSNPSIWGNNPFNRIITDPCDFFMDENAQRVTKNLIRYVVARWGYATNIMAWELWNEVTGMCAGYNDLEHDVVVWHKIMLDHLRTADPFGHCISTSITSSTKFPALYSILFNALDFVQQHHYQDIQSAMSTQQLSYGLYKLNLNDVYPTKPFFAGEFGFGQSSTRPKYEDKDPHGIDLHNSLWSSLFSTSMGSGSFWWWPYLRTKDLFTRFKPILNFCQNMPILSDSFESYTTGTETSHILDFPNSLETYFMKNSNEDTVYGWCQDTAFCFQSLRWLTDSAYKVYPDSTDLTKYEIVFSDSVVLDPGGYIYTMNPLKKPGPSSNSNLIKIPITTKSVGSPYNVEWFNTETGAPYGYATASVSVQQNPDGTKYLPIMFPSFIRDLTHHQINNTFGDVAFVIKYLGDVGPLDKTH